MTTFFKGSDKFAKVKADMNTALNQAYSTSSVDYLSKDWATDTNLLGPLPSGMTREQYESLINGGA